MTFPMKRVATAVALVLIALPVTAVPMDDLLKQADSLPDDFSAHFFDAPLLTRVELDGEFLGDAMILLARNQTLQLVKFTESKESRLPAQKRAQWTTALAQPVSLGNCTQKCPSGLVNLQYNLSTATLYIATDAAKVSKGDKRYHTLPEGGSTGLILRNQLNIVGGEVQPWSGYQGMQLESSIGNWSGVAQSQVSRSDLKESETQARLSSLYLQRELPDHAIRAGLFMPDSQGILRQPQMPGRSSVQTVVGVMAASSDALVEFQPRPSLYPVYVTANRDAMVEIYRDGMLINSQPVKAGMQQLDTTSLPGGIYGVEVRLLEDGREVSRSEETIYKPNNWGHGDQRFRYNLYGGVEKELAKQRYHQQQNNTALGLSGNYLLHPRVVVGGAAQRSDTDNQFGLSSDIQTSGSTRFYGSTGFSDRWGSRFDTQFNWQYQPQTSLMLNHAQSWIQNDQRRCTNNCSVTRQKSSGLTLNHRLSGGDAVSLRTTHYSKENGIGLDANWRTRFQVKDTPVSMTVNAFDRPYGIGEGARNRGANLNFSFSLGGDSRSVTANIGTRNDIRGNRDLYASAGVTQRFTDSAIPRVSAGVTADHYGVGANTYVDFEHRYASGSVYGQQSTYNRKLSGGLNMSNTLAAGGGKVSLSHSADASKTGMIIDVESDDPDVSLKAWDSHGSSARLRAGRNFIPASAWKSGQVQVDFADRDGPALKVWPTEIPYHLNKGGVAHAKVRVMKTVTVIGRVVDHQGAPLSGAKLVNHAGQGIAESDGFFIADMHEHTPELTIHARDNKLCTVTLNPAEAKRENNTLMVGDLSCKPGGNG